MVFFNYALRKLNAKIVYYGPGLCGKTTNLQWVHDHFEGGQRGKMISLATEGDRTIFFDLLPLDIGKIRGMDVTLQLYTVPGQVHYNTTRQLVLKGADGVVFIADSQRAMLKSNIESLHNLKVNLRLQGIELPVFPHIFQFNKRDLRDILPAEELDEALNEHRMPIFDAIATEGIGVQDTLEGIVKLVMRSLRARYEAAIGAPVTTHPIDRVTGRGPGVPHQMPVVIPSPTPAPAMEASASVAPPSEEAGVAFPQADDSDPGAITHPGEDLISSSWHADPLRDADSRDTDIFTDPTADIEPVPDEMPVLEVAPDPASEGAAFDLFISDRAETPAAPAVEDAPVEELVYEPPAEDELEPAEELTEADETPQPVEEGLEYEGAPSHTSPLSTEDVAEAAREAGAAGPEEAWAEDELLSANGLGEPVPEPEPRAPAAEPFNGVEPDLDESAEEGVVGEWPPPPVMPGEKAAEPEAGAPALELDTDAVGPSPFVLGEGDPFGAPPFQISDEPAGEPIQVEILGSAPDDGEGPRVAGIDVVPSDNQLQLRLEGTGVLAESGQVRELDIRVPVPGEWVGHRRVTLQLRLTLEPLPEETE